MVYILYKNYLLSILTDNFLRWSPTLETVSQSSTKVLNAMFLECSQFEKKVILTMEFYFIDECHIYYVIEKLDVVISTIWAMQWDIQVLTY